MEFCVGNDRRWETGDGKQMDPALPRDHQHHPLRVLCPGSQKIQFCAWQKNCVELKLRVQCGAHKAQRCMS